MSTARCLRALRTACPPRDHGSQPNNGTTPRSGFACRYMPGTSVYHHDQAEVRDQPGYGHESRALMLVRGQDLTGRNNFERGHERIDA